MANEDRATRYHRLHRRAAVGGTVLTTLFLFLVLISGGSVALRDVARDIAGNSAAGLVLVYVLALVAAHEVLRLPLSYYQSVTLERRYGLSTQTTRQWWKDYAKALILGAVFVFAAAWTVNSLMRWSGVYWWIVAAAVAAAVLVLLAQLAPVVLLPLFYDFKPLDRAPLAGRLVALAERAGAPVVGVFEWRLSDRTRKANAAFTGLGRTRRILLSDTLLGEYTDDEVEVILAHELAHQVHRDLWTAIVCETLLIALAFAVADRILDVFVPVLGLADKSDPAALPALALTLGAVTLVFVPLANAVSRRHERRADRFALEMTGNVSAFVSAMRRLAAQNLAEERPSRVVEWMFHSHPPTSARIDAAKAWGTRHLTGA